MPDAAREIRVGVGGARVRNLRVSSFPRDSSFVALRQKPLGRERFGLAEVFRIQKRDARVGGEHVPGGHVVLEELSRRRVDA